MRNPLPQRVLLITLLAACLAAPGCGDQESEEGSVPSTTDSTDANDPTDVSSPTDPADTGDDTDVTDPAEPDPPTEMYDCGGLLDCLDTCSDGDDDTCASACEESASPEAVQAAETYFVCIEDCSNLDGAEVDACVQEVCDPLYLQCVLPQTCIDACSHLTDLCGDDLPLNRQTTRTYRTAGVDHLLFESQLQFVIAWHPGTRQLPSKLTSVTEITHYTPLTKRGMTQLTVDAEHAESGLAEALLRSHPDIEAIYPVLSTASGQTLLTTNEIIARFDSPEAFEAAQAKLSDLDVTVERAIRGLPSTWLLTTKASDALSGSIRFMNSGLVRWAHPNFLRHYAPRRVPNDPYFTHQWHLHNPGAQPRALEGADMRAVSAWDITFGDPSIILAINDDGVDFAHPDFTFLRDDEDNPITVNGPSDIEAALPEGCCSHGTSVAGVAAATGDNALGTAGVCPSCTTLPVFTDYTNPSEDAAVAETFAESDSAGAWVINNSWGPMDGLPPVIEADETAPEPLSDVITDILATVANEGRGGQGVSIVFAAGNGNESVDSDAFVSNPNTIGVAAVSSLGFKSFYSDFGDGVWVSAPSDGALGIVTSDIRGDYGYNGTGAGELDPSGDTTDTFGGTSSAAPAVSGLLGLIYSANPELTAAQAKDILRRTSRKIDQVNGLYTEDADGFLWSPYYGYGLVDAHAAVRAAVLGCSPESLEVCIPAVTCADGPQLGIPEVCNGVDDDCDGDTDEEVCAADPIGCEPCNLAGTCDGGCTYLADDPGPSCLAPCSDDLACDEGFGCDSGFCIPDSGRCSEPSEELCDGRDNDADGLIDEEACEPGDGESCEFDGQCPTGFVCQYERCFQTCEDVADCANNDACLALADGYGQALDTSVCAPEFDFDFSCEEGCLFLYQNAPGPLFDALLGCVMDATTCDEASGCIPN